VAHTYEELKGKTVAELREIAATIEHEAVKGHSQMNKEHLLEALCKALSIDMHAHRVAVGVDKAALKAKIQELKKIRDQAKAAKDAKKVLVARSKIRRLKRELRQAVRAVA
jgi:DNA-binding IclR family transcriptional regulator